MLFGDAALVPLAGPVVEVVATAKTNMPAGTVLDGLGGYHTFGVAERADVTCTEGLLPMGVAEGCTLLRDVERDEVLTYADVRLPSGRLVDELRRQQARSRWARRD